MIDYAHRFEGDEVDANLAELAHVYEKLTTVAFNREYGFYYGDAFAHFDARIFTIPDPVEVADYFLWRQRDCVRNSITTRQTGEREITFTHKQTGQETTTTAMCSCWEATSAPSFNATPGGWLADTIPVIPALTDRRAS